MYSWPTNHSLWLLEKSLGLQTPPWFQVWLMLLCVLPCLYRSARLCSRDWVAPELKQSPYTRSSLYSSASCLRAGGDGEGLGSVWGAIWGNIIRLYVWSGQGETECSSMRQTGIPHLFSPFLIHTHTYTHVHKHTHVCESPCFLPLLEDVNQDSVSNLCFLLRCTLIYLTLILERVTWL